MGNALSTTVALKSLAFELLGSKEDAWVIPKGTAIIPVEIGTLLSQEILKDKAIITGVVEETKMNWYTKYGFVYSPNGISFLEGGEYVYVDLNKPLDGAYMTDYYIGFIVPLRVLQRVLK